MASTQYLVGGLGEVFEDSCIFQDLEVGALEGVLPIAAEDEDGARAEAVGKFHVVYIWVAFQMPVTSIRGF